MFNFKCSVIAALALPVMTGCMNTESVTVRGPNGEETMKRTDSLTGSDRTIVVANEQAYRDCLSLNAPTMGSSYADMYCRSVTTPGSSFYQPAGPYMRHGGMPFGGAVYPFPAGHGVHEYAGSIADPVQAGYAVANARADATYPEATKNPQDFARRSELHTVVRQTRRLGNALGETRADLLDHKKGVSESVPAVKPVAGGGRDKEPKRRANESPGSAPATELKRGELSPEFKKLLRDLETE